MKTKHSKKVISSSNLPAKYPLFQALTSWIALEHWNAPQWLFGAVGLIFILLFLNAIGHNLIDEDVDLFDK